MNYVDFPENPFIRATGVNVDSIKDTPISNEEMMECDEIIISSELTTVLFEELQNYASCCIGLLTKEQLDLLCRIGANKNGEETVLEYLSENHLICLQELLQLALEGQRALCTELNLELFENGLNETKILIADFLKANGVAALA